MRIAISLIVILLLTGCHHGPAKPPADTDRLASAYVALLRLKSKVGGPDTSVTSRSFERMSADTLRAYGYTTEEFRQQVGSLSGSRDELERFTLRIQTLSGVH
jgi:hypothetical protein